MMGLGTIINTGAILIGGLLGILLENAIPEKIQNTLIKAMGICVLFLGISGALQEMLTVEGEKLTSSGGMMVIISFILGSLVGEIIDIEQRIEQFGAWLKRKTKNGSDAKFIEGFVTTSLIVSIGAMAVVGAIQDGLWGDYSLLAAKAILDFIIVMIMAASIGKGCVFAAIPVALFQGGITILAGFIQPIMTDQAMPNLSLTASILIFCVGVNLVWGNRIKVANMLPSILFAIVLAFLPAFL
ncbi:MAG: DUF554 domain-containing protein [Clostridiales bacterium]|nr:DUF554 domain-containing protein [Clostridiales bacterium]